MKINETEALVGITKKNIRFYEQEGTNFMNRQKQDVRSQYIGSTIAAAVIILIMGGLIALFGWCCMIDSDPMPLGIMLVMDLPCVAVAVGVVIALIQRMKELQSHELDDLEKY